MAFTAFINSDIFTLVIIPILIFLARIADVSIGTLRIIFIYRGLRLLAPLLGFFEVFIWLLAARQVFVSLAGWVPLLAYSAGFAAGTYVGIVIEQKVSIGKVLLRVITNRDAKKLLNAFEEEEFPITSTHAVCSKGNVRVIFLVIPRKKVGAALDLIKKHNPRASYSVEDVRFASENHAAAPRSRLRGFGMFRKGK